MRNYLNTPCKNLARIILALAFYCILISCGSASKGGANSGDNYDYSDVKKTSWQCIDQSVAPVIVANNGCFDPHSRTVKVTVYNASADEIQKWWYKVSQCGSYEVNAQLTASEFMSLNSSCSNNPRDVQTLWDDRGNVIEGSSSCSAAEEKRACIKLWGFSAWDPSGCKPQYVGSTQRVQGCYSGYYQDESSQRHLGAFFKVSDDSVYASQLIDLGNCTGEYNFKALSETCGFLTKLSTQDSLIPYSSCEREIDQGNCSSTQSFYDDSWYVNKGGALVDSVIKCSGDSPIIYEGDNRNPYDYNQPPSKPFGEPVYGYPKDSVPVVANCADADTRMYMGENSSGPVWSILPEPLPCNAVLKCQDVIDAEATQANSSQQVKDRFAKCQGSSMGCDWMEISNITYSGAKIRYPRIATSFGDSGTVQSAPYHKVAIPISTPVNVALTVSLDTALAIGNYLNKASLVLTGNFNFLTHSANGPVTTNPYLSRSILLTSGNTTNKGNGKWEFNGTFDLGNAPSTIGYLGGYYKLELTNGVGAASITTVADTIYVPYGVPKDTSFFPKSIPDPWIVVADSLEFGKNFRRGVTATTEIKGFENALTDFRLISILEKLRGKLRQVDAIDYASTIMNEAYYWTYDWLLTHSIPGGGCRFRPERSRIWDQFGGGLGGQCQEYSMALDNVSRILGLQEGFDYIQMAAIYGKKDQCVGVKYYYTGEIASYDVNDTPLGNWIFAKNYVWNSVITFQNHHKTYYLGWYNDVKSSLAEISSLETSLQMAYWSTVLDTARMVSYPGTPLHENTFTDAEWKALCNNE